MNPERYGQVARLFHAAVELPSGERAVLLDRACAGDAELRREVESLLASDQQDKDFIEAPALEVAAGLLAREQPQEQVGRQLSHYQIASLLGAGGMGEVYLAEDTRLQRKVALKLLPAAFTQDRERVRRFKKEAQAASALNHPNIPAIYDVGETDGLHFIAMEYVEGQTLRQLLHEGGLKFEPALEIALQTADALDAAHRAGIVHRDIKPENLMIRPDGLVKVLDFGLARFTEAAANRKQSASALTNPGRVVGTINYMSPEQALAATVDARSDLFSLGVVLYEMLTGAQPFAGTSDAAVYDAILHQTPTPLCELSPQLPAGLDRILNHLLEKNVEARCQTAADLRARLLALKQNPGAVAALPAAAPPTRTSSAPKSAPRNWRLTLAAGGALLLVAALALAGYRWFAPRGGAAERPLGEPRFIPLVSKAGRKDHAAFSPDGIRIAFAWDGGRIEEVGPADIYVKVIGADDPPLRLTTAPENDNFPTWTPDGKYVTFVRGRNGKGEVMRVPAEGGPEQTLAETFTTASWAPDGKTLAVSGLPRSAEGPSIVLVNPATGQRTRLTTPGPSQADHFPEFSPDGKWVAFFRDFGENQVDICIVPASGGTPRQLTFERKAISGLAWTSDSREIVFSATRQGTRGLWRVSVQGGPPARLAVNARHPITPDISRQGDKLTFTEVANDVNLWLYQGAGFAGRDVPGKFGAPVQLLVNSLYSDQSPALSPDGQKLVFSSDRNGDEGLWLCDAEGKTPARLLTPSGTAGSPRWSYDGQWIAFDSYDEGDGNIYVINPTGDGKWRRLTPEKSSESQPAWSHDGQWIYFKSNRSGTNQIYKVPVAGGEAKQITFNGGFEGYESPDGKLFYFTKERGNHGIYSVPANGGKEELAPELKEAGYWRSWTLVNQGICFPVKKSDAEWALQFFSFATRRTSSLFTVTDAPLWWMPGLALSEDGRRLIYAHLEKPYDELILMENFR